MQKSELINNSAILAIVMCIDDLKDARKACKKYLNKIGVTLTKEERNSLVDKISEIVKPYQHAMQIANTSAMNQLSELKAAPAADYQSYIKSQKEVSKNPENHL